MYKPIFPYLGPQVIISSGRVLAHSKDDMIFLFGKKGIGLSTPATLNFDVGERLLITSPKIELGYQAEVKGEPVLLGKSTVIQLSALCDALKGLADALAKMNAKELETAIPMIVAKSTILSGQATTISDSLNNSCLSQTTYTK